jgi:hypothetical protein
MDTSKLIELGDVTEETLGNIQGVTFDQSGKHT